jgi:uncharacterized protein (TIGR02186 family)
MRLGALLLAAVAALPLPAAAEAIVAELSQTRVSITANCDGSEILVFGAVKREAPLPEGELDVVITVLGPLEPIVVRRKSRVAGIWVNTASVEVDAAPTFYAIATTGPLAAVMSDTEDLRHKVSIARAIRSVGAPQNVTDSESFTEALIRIRQDTGLYQLEEGGVRLKDATLFDTAFALPANLTEGEYRTRIFLTRDGTVIDRYETTISVSKVGLERYLFALAHDSPALYGLLSLLIAIAAGWGASSAFRYLRR